jgi:hypothetical protein
VSWIEKEQDHMVQDRLMALANKKKKASGSYRGSTCLARVRTSSSIKEDSRARVLVGGIGSQGDRGVEGGDVMLSMQQIRSWGGAVNHATNRRDRQENMAGWMEIGTQDMLRLKGKYHGNGYEP